MTEQENKTVIKEGQAGKFGSLLRTKGFSVQSEMGKDNVEIIHIEPSNIVEIATFLKINIETCFDILISVCGVDNNDSFEAVYHLFSTEYGSKLVLKAKLDKNNPEIESISEVYSAANWHERETYDLLGITFLNHPNLTRILLPNDWKGHPLRKDYKMNDERLVWNER